MSEPTEQIFGKSKTGDANVDDSCSLKLERAGDVNNLDDLYEKRDVVAEWQFPSHGKLHRIEFQHGTTSGKRILWIDGNISTRVDVQTGKMRTSGRNSLIVLLINFFTKKFNQLVGDDIFHLEDLRCVLRVDPEPGFKYKYSLFVEGKPLEQFKQSQAKAMLIWEATIRNKCYRIVLEKDNLNIYSNGVLREETGEFTDVGTKTIWMENGNTFVLTTENSVDKQADLTYKLTINGLVIENQ